MDKVLIIVVRALPFVILFSGLTVEFLKMWGII